MSKVRSQLEYTTAQGRLFEGLTDAFTKSLVIMKLHYVRHRQVDFCVVNSEYFDNHSEFKKMDPSMSRQSCSDEIARKLPHVAMHNIRKLTRINSTYGVDASVPVVVQYVALHSMCISSYMQVLDIQSEE